MNNKTITQVLAAAAVIGGIIYFYRKSKAPMQEEEVQSGEKKSEEAIEFAYLEARKKAKRECFSIIYPLGRTASLESEMKGMAYQNCVMKKMKFVAGGIG